MGVQRRRLVLVVGPGRSGTSMVAGILRRAGWHVPQPEFPSSRANPKGYFESKWVYGFHEELLMLAGVRYIAITDPVEFEYCTTVSRSPRPAGELRRWLDQQFRESRDNALLIKDPRTVCFVPLWLDVGDAMGIEVSVVSMIRDPLEVVGSQDHYYRPPDDRNRRLRAWTLTALYGEYATRSRPRSFVSFRDLIADPAGTFAPLATLLLRGAERRVAAALEFVDPALHRIKRDGGDAADAVLAEAYATLRALTDLSRHPDGRCAEAELALDGLRHSAGFGSAAEPRRASAR